jgi:hypothetical protein
MIYIKRILWLLGYPIMYLLSCILLMIAFVFTIFKWLFLYIKTGNTQYCLDCFEILFKIMEWYIDIEPKESKL